MAETIDMAELDKKIAKFKKEMSKFDVDKSIRGIKQRSDARWAVHWGNIADREKAAIKAAKAAGNAAKVKTETAKLNKIKNLNIPKPTTRKIPKSPVVGLAAFAADLGLRWAAMSPSEKKELRAKRDARERKEMGSFDPLPHIQVGKKKKKKKKKSGGKVSKKYASGGRVAKYKG